LGKRGKTIWKALGTQARTEKKKKKHFLALMKAMWMTCALERGDALELLAREVGKAKTNGGCRHKKRQIECANAYAKDRRSSKKSGEDHRGAQCPLFRWRRKGINDLGRKEGTYCITSPDLLALGPMGKIIAKKVHHPNARNVTDVL